jgi:hypothetical protein
MLGLLERANLNCWPSEDGNRSSFQNVMFFRIIDSGQSTITR